MGIRIISIQDDIITYGFVLTWKIGNQLSPKLCINLLSNVPCQMMTIRPTLYITSISSIASKWYDIILRPVRLVNFTNFRSSQFLWNPCLIYIYFITTMLTVFRLSQNIVIIIMHSKKRFEWVANSDKNVGKITLFSIVLLCCFRFPFQSRLHKLKNNNENQKG